MFGIKIVTKKGLEEIKRNAMNQATANLVALLRHKDKIFLEPVTLIGNNQVIQDCAFLGIEGDALTVKDAIMVLAKASIGEKAEPNWEKHAATIKRKYHKEGQR